MCGLSLGGLVALWLGIHAPERLHRLIFANTAARIGSREMWEQRIETVQNTDMSTWLRRRSSDGSRQLIVRSIRRRWNRSAR